MKLESQRKRPHHFNISNYIESKWWESKPRGHISPTPLAFARPRWFLDNNLSLLLTKNLLGLRDIKERTINIRRKDDHGMTFTTISWVKGLNCLRFRPPFSYEWYEKMGTLVGAALRKAKEDRLRRSLYTISLIYYMHLITFLLFTFFIIEHCYFIIIHIIPHVIFEVAFLIVLSRL